MRVSSNELFSTLKNLVYAPLKVLVWRELMEKS